MNPKKLLLLVLVLFTVLSLHAQKKNDPQIKIIQEKLLVVLKDIYDTYDTTK